MQLQMLEPKLLVNAVIDLEFSRYSSHPVANDK